MRFVYCDESVFRNDRVGYAVLATDRVVSQAIVDGAMADLAADPDDLSIVGNGLVP
ncbi:MAG: hypothetical protein ABSA52_22920 [Candidatus Binatia bacterium]|jgi:hypothetical protein